MAFVKDIVSVFVCVFVGSSIFNVLSEPAFRWHTVHLKKCVVPTKTFLCQLLVHRQCHFFIFWLCMFSFFSCLSFSRSRYPCINCEFSCTDIFSFPNFVSPQTIFFGQKAQLKQQNANVTEWAKQTTTWVSGACHRKSASLCFCFSSECIAHMFLENSPSQIYFRSSARVRHHRHAIGVSLVNVKQLDIEYMCKNTNEREIFSDKTKRIAKFFDFSLNVAHILCSLVVVVICRLHALPWIFKLCRCYGCWCCFYFFFFGLRAQYRLSAPNFCFVRGVALIFCDCIKCKMLQGRWKLAIWKRVCELVCKRCAFLIGLWFKRWHVEDETHATQQHNTTQHRTNIRNVTFVLNDWMLRWATELSARSLLLPPFKNWLLKESHFNIFKFDAYLVRFCHNTHRMHITFFLSTIQTNKLKLLFNLKLKFLFFS